MPKIDWKYDIQARNPVSGNTHTAADAILFLARDAAVPVALRAYREECARIGAGENHLKAIDELIVRVDTYQVVHGYKVPDTDLPGEVDRCVNGVGVE